METTDFFCRRCGVLNSAARQHCRECGASLAGGPGAEPAPWAAPRPPASTAVGVCPRCRKGNPQDVSVCSDCGGRLGLTVSTPPGVERGVTHPPLPCPACATQMETGTAFLVSGGFWEQAFAGAHSWLQLVFRRDEALRLEKVVIPGQKVHAQRCPGCNAVWIGPPPSR